MLYQIIIDNQLHIMQICCTHSDYIIDILGFSNDEISQIINSLLSEMKGEK